MKYLLYILSIFFIGSVYGQFDKEYFEEVFEEELGYDNNKRENHSGVYMHTSPQAVPEWFITPPISEQSSVFAIGISDPEMDSTLGFETALFRAQIMANVLYYSTTQMLCDFFLIEVNNANNVVFEHFSRINAKVPFEHNYELIKTHTNGFNETMVLIKYVPTKIKRHQHSKVKLEIYKNEIEASNYGNFESVFEMLVEKGGPNKDTTALYQLTELGKRYDVVSMTEGSINQVPIYNLRYRGIPSSDSVDIHFFSHGLWKEYLKAVMTHIIGIARLKPENIQHLTETYQHNSSEKLTRGISVNKMRFVLQGFNGINNQLKANMKEISLSQ